MPCPRSPDSSSLSPSHRPSPQLAKFDPPILQFGGSPSDIPHTSHLTAGAPTPPYPQRVSALRSLPTQAPGSRPASICASNPGTPTLHSEARPAGAPQSFLLLREVTHLHAPPPPARRPCSASLESSTQPSFSPSSPNAPKHPPVPGSRTSSLDSHGLPAPVSPPADPRSPPTPPLTHPGSIGLHLQSAPGRGRNAESLVRHPGSFWLTRIQDPSILSQRPSLSSPGVPSASRGHFLRNLSASRFTPTPPSAGSSRPRRLLPATARAPLPPPAARVPSGRPSAGPSLRLPAGRRPLPPPRPSRRPLLQDGGGGGGG